VTSMAVASVRAAPFHEAALAVFFFALGVRAN